MIEGIKVIGFDADDTLWVNEPYYREVEEEFIQLVTSYGVNGNIAGALFETEIANLGLYVYGIKAFMLSLVECAIQLTDGGVSTGDISRIIGMGKSMLEQLGYAVIVAGEPAKALDIARNHPGKLHLLITDVIMPKMSGTELAEQVEQIRPETRVLFISGYPADEISQRAELREGVYFMHKPLTFQGLARKVREVLENGT